MYRVLLLGACVVPIIGVLPAQAAVTTFASYVQSSSGAGIRFTRTGTSTGVGAVDAASAGGHLYTITNAGDTNVGARAVDFSFLQPQLQAAIGTVDAAFTLDLTTIAAPASLSNGVLSQQGLSGSFSFVYTGTSPLVIGNTTYYTNANLLSGTIAPSWLTGQVGSTSAGLTGATSAGSTITYTSDFLTFVPGGDYDFSLALTQIAPTVGRTDQYHALNGFRAVTTGSFSADPRLLLKAIPQAVPEPATWGMMVIGFALLGHQLRRRKADRMTGLAMIG